MLNDYRDVRERVDMAPLWFDDHGVPRYRPFTARLLDVYDDAAVLAEVACQSCRSTFLVGVGSDPMGRLRDAVISAWATGRMQPPGEVDAPTGEQWLSHCAEAFCFGDPPRHGCAGDTMSCDELRLIEAWVRDRDTWRRRPEFECAPPRFAGPAGAA